ncbi:MAG: protein translocase subunit SecF [Halanaerobiales bacterium]
MDILGKRKIWYIISLIVIVLGLFFMIYNGTSRRFNDASFSSNVLNFGIDFQGGTILEYKFDNPVSNEEVRQVLLNFDYTQDAVIQQSQEGGLHGVLIRTKELSPEQIIKVEDALQSEYPSAENLRTDIVGPTIGEELRIAALWALVLASIAIIIYISVRFEFRFAIVAIIALLHDVLITMGIFAILGKEINTAFVAALLTIIGYSINDTIVIFDRIRENMKRMQREPFIELANEAVVDTLPRSINTSLTTLIGVLAIYFFGGASLKTFMLALFVGMFAGTYSSIFVASPLLETWRRWKSRLAT